MFLALKSIKCSPSQKSWRKNITFTPWPFLYFRVIVIKIHKIIHNHSFPINSSLLFSVILCQLFKEQNNYITFFCAPPFLSEPLSYLSRPCGSSKHFSLLPCLLPFWPITSDPAPSAFPGYEHLINPIEGNTLENRNVTWSPQHR